MEKIRQYIVPAVSALFVFFSSCTEEDALAPDPLPVVESYLTPGQPVKVQITKEILYGKTDTLIPLEGLTVQISHNGQSWPLVETAAGQYGTTSLQIAAGETYRLSFTYSGQEITATTEVPAFPGTVTASGTSLTVPQLGSGTGVDIPDPIQYNWDNPDQEYHLLVVRNMEADPQPITFNIGDDVIEKPEPVFRIPPHRGNSQQLSLGRFSYYGRHAVILYRIQPEYAALYEDNGNNSGNLVAPPTNISNGLGIFTGVNAADTLWVHIH